MKIYTQDVANVRRREEKFIHLVGTFTRFAQPLVLFDDALLDRSKTGVGEGTSPGDARTAGKVNI